MNSACHSHQVERLVWGSLELARVLASYIYNLASSSGQQYIKHTRNQTLRKILKEGLVDGVEVYQAEHMEFVI